MKIYNLFPRLAGPFTDWQPHLERAAAMGFDWIFVNPIQQTGRSGSLYSIADYLTLAPDFRRPRSRTGAKKQFAEVVETAERLGLSLMVDLVINHCASDSPLVKQHPEWFVREGGRVAHPFCIEADGNRVVWHDLAQFDFVHSSDREGLIAFCIEVVDFLADLGFRGFRCDAAYQLPPEVWSRIIEHARKRDPRLVFVAETLGCTPEQTRATAGAGFSAIFNSSKWWDFSSDWLLEQYALTRTIAPSISFPESHDTERLYRESGRNRAAMEQRYAFAALYSAGLMMPIGYEFGFSAPLDVVNTRPDDWEHPNLDLTDFISAINTIKNRCPVFQCEGPIERRHSDNPAILVLNLRQDDGDSEALLILNKDPWNRQYFRCGNLSDLLARPRPLEDLSPIWTMDYLPAPFEFDLAPGMMRILVTRPDT